MYFITNIYYIPTYKTLNSILFPGILQDRGNKISNKFTNLILYPDRLLKIPYPWISMNDYEELDEKGEYSTLLELAEQDLSTAEAKYWQITALWRLAELDRGLDLGLTYESVDLDNYWKARIQSRISALYVHKGELDKALEYINKSLVLFEEVAKPQDIATSLNNIGVIYSQKGELDKALEYYTRSLELFQQVGDLQNTAGSLSNIGELYRSKGELKKALEYFDRCLELREQLGNPHGISIVLMNIVTTHVLRNNNENAEPYLNQLLDIKDKYPDDKAIQLFADFTRAVVLKSSIRNREKVRAQNILERIVETNDFNHHLLLIALNHLVELLLYEYKLYGEDVVLEEIKRHIDLMYDTAQDQYLLTNLIEVLILKSRLALADQQFDEANTLLTQAILVAEENNLQRYTNIVREEIVLMETDLRKMKETIEESDIGTRIEKSKILDYIARAREITG